MPIDWTETFKVFGIAAPFIVMLFYLLRQQTEERQVLTRHFIETLDKTIIQNSESQIRLSEGFHKTAESITVIASSIREVAEKHSDEHTRILDAIVMRRRQEDRE